MTNVAGKEVFHSYLDDIRYQAVKESRRTSFSSIDYKIVSNNAQAIRDIEKHKRLSTADHNRQTNAYLQKLEKLNKMKAKRHNVSSVAPTGDSRARRHSAPTVFWAQMPQPQSQLAMPSPLTRRPHTNYLQRSTDKTQTAPLNVSSYPSTSPTESGSKMVLQRMSSLNMQQPRMTYRSSPEARRMSYDLQIETTKTAMQKLDEIVNTHKRRATIAEGVKSDFMSALEAKRELADRSNSIEEEESVG